MATRTLLKLARVIHTHTRLLVCMEGRRIARPVGCRPRPLQLLLDFRSPLPLCLQGQMDSRGSSMTDTSPLMKIKEALASLRTEVKSMELRIGVVGHTLMQSKLK